MEDTANHELELHGHEDLFTFFSLNKARKKYTDLADDTFEHYVDHLPGLSNLRPAAAAAAALDDLGPQNPQQPMVRVETGKGAGAGGQLAGLIAEKRTRIGQFMYNEPPAAIELRNISQQRLTAALSFQGSRPLGLLDMTQPVRAKKKKKKKKRKHKDKDGVDERSKKKSKLEGASPESAQAQAQQAQAHAHAQAPTAMADDFDVC